MSACDFITPQETTKISQVSDGVDATAGPVGIRNAMLITADGTSASLVASFVNTTSTQQTVELQYTSASGPTTQQVVVPGNGLLSVRPGAQVSVTLDGVKATPGALFQTHFAVGSKGEDVRIPVLSPDLPGYETLTPTPTPTPTPTKTPKAGTSTSPSPSASASPAA